ncbi:Alpha/beta hydrolase fold-1 [Xylaria venustula]|nr:Alpha/beta hydrolase fold-1 [Xylaria venustula]
MTSTSKPTILIVHGAWHIPKSYAKLVTALESSGFEVHIPRLPSVKNIRPPDCDLFSDSEVIRSYAEDLLKNERTFAVLAHSYGGQVGTNALYGLGVKARSAQGLSGGVSHLIYMTAYAVLEGVSMMDKVAQHGNMDLVPLAFGIAEDNSCVSNDPKGLVVSPGPEVNQEELEEYLDTFERWNAKCMYQGIQHAAWREISVSFIYATHDMTVHLHYQKEFVEVMEKEGCKVQTFELEAGHCPNFTATDGVVDIVKKVVLA